jgi:hypothetical protein
MLAILPLSATDCGCGYSVGDEVISISYNCDGSPSDKATRVSRNIRTGAVTTSSITVFEAIKLCQ